MRCLSCNTLQGLLDILQGRDGLSRCGQCHSDDLLLVEFVEATHKNVAKQEILCLNCNLNTLQPPDMSICRQCYSDDLFIVDSEATSKNVRHMFQRGRIWFAIGIIIVIVVVAIRNIDFIRHTIGI